MASKLACGLATGLFLSFASPAQADCAADIGDAAKNIAGASADIIKMIADCKGSDRTACGADVNEMLSNIDAAEKSIAQSVQDCGGQSAECTAAVQKIGDAIGKCGPEASKVAEACAPGKSAFLCVADSILLSGEVAGVAADIASAVQACKKAFLVEVEAGSCAADIAESAKNVAAASADIVKMAGECKGLDRSACGADIQAMLSDFDAAEKSIAQAVQDCDGQSAQCTAAVQKIGDAIGTCGPEAAKVAEDCAPGKPAFLCVADSILLSGDVAGLAASIAEAVKECKSDLLAGLSKDAAVVLV
eukprot:TRINITY_DN1625_c0_g2_i3.p1 TRINITY_DN1625_c0_g2~~TRINITY_DN1625_c0_g2_i3.p1  ORF type:complete len:324 (-),score=92.03 TRINITY_DN1625_c0_g2_i3:259-1170(-)